MPRGIKNILKYIKNYFKIYCKTKTKLVLQWKRLWT